MLAPGANLWHAFVLFDEAKASGLSSDNVLVLLVNLCLGLSVMRFVSAFNSFEIFFGFWFGFWG